jgi:tight adherence protein B
MQGDLAAPVTAGVMLAAGLVFAGLGRWGWVQHSQLYPEELTDAAAVPRTTLARLRALPRSGAVTRLAQAVAAHQSAAAILGMAVAAVILGALAGRFVLGALVAAGLVLVALWELSQEDARRRERLAEQLAPAAETMAAAIQSGYSIQQAIDRVAREGERPLSDEFARVGRALRLGQSLEAAMTGLAARVQHPDYDFFTTALMIQYRLGGNLGSLMWGLAQSIHERLQFRAEFRALTAQARLSGQVLIGLPLFTFAAVYMFNGAYLAPLLNTGLGRGVLVFAVLLLVIGAATIRAMSRVRA